MIDIKYPRNEILEHPARYKVVVNGRRWGKTYLDWYFLHYGEIPPMMESWFVAPTYRQGKIIAWPVIKKIHQSMGWDSVRYYETDLLAVLPNDHHFRIVGAENEDKLRGSGLWKLAVDEVDFMSQTIFPNVLRPMLSDNHAPAMFSGTADGMKQLYNFYLRGQDPKESDWMSWQFKSIEHGYIDPAEIEEARRDLDEKTFRQEYEGSFETLGNRVYYSFVRGEHGEVRGDLKGHNLQTVIGMDFNVSKMSAVIGYRIGKDHIHWFDELVLRDSNTFEMAEELKARYPKANVYPDASGSARKSSSTKSDHQILRDAGFNVIARKKQPPVRDRVNAVNSRFKSASGEVRMTVDVNQCPELVADLERVQWSGGDIDKKDLERTHASDAMGYCVEFLWPINRGFVGSIMR